MLAPQTLTPSTLHEQFGSILALNPNYKPGLVCPEVSFRADGLVREGKPN